ncbi:MAG: hypothetical protein JWN23_989 [Rhodocyclales bacterium]|nr:hypothetical protein [Rhodocyclales bacterium]
MKLLLRPKPLPDELFSSWLVRLASANISKVHPFAKRLFPRKVNFWDQDPDLTIDPRELHSLAELTGVEPPRLAQTSLSSYEGIVFEKAHSVGVTKWVLQAENNGRARRGRGQQYCWKCLADDPVPYFRKHWRLAFNVVCLEHACWLLDGCPCCDAPISFHESDFRKQASGREDGMLRCRRCSQPRTRVEEQVSPVPDELMRFQTLLMTAAEQGFSLELPGGALYALLSFHGLRRLVGVLTSTGRSARLRYHLLNGDGRLALGIRYRNGKSKFENMRVGDRAESLLLLSMLLNNWPNDFIEGCKTARVASSYLKGYGENLPYWLARELQWHLYDRFYSPNDDEREAVRAYLEKRRINPTNNEINRMLGVAFRPLVANDSLHVTGRSWNPRGPHRKTPPHTDRGLAS